MRRRRQSSKIASEANFSRPRGDTSLLQEIIAKQVKLVTIYIYIVYIVIDEILIRNKVSKFAKEATQRRIFNW